MSIISSPVSFVSLIISGIDENEDLTEEKKEVKDSSSKLWKILMKKDLPHKCHS